jgi:hypothetical protein
MSIKDLVRPLKSHSLGVPPVMQDGLRHMADMKQRLNHLTGKTVKTTDERREQEYIQSVLSHQLSVGLNIYEDLLKRIDTMLNHDVDVEHEQEAADIVTHLVIDAAFIHMCISGADDSIGKFPYDYLANKIFPVQDKPSAETVCQ